MQNQMTVLPIPVPPAPILEQAVGYQNDRHARFLALWWEPCGDEVMVSDGFVTFTGSDVFYRMIALANYICIFDCILHIIFIFSTKSMAVIIY